MAFSFLQRGNPTEYARQLSLTSYEPLLVLENLVTGIDNLRHDVFLSPRFCDAARQHIFRLIAKHGGIEELAASESPSGLQQENLPARLRDLRARGVKPLDHADFKRLLTEIHMVALNKAKAENNICLDLLFYLASLKFQRTELLNQYNLVLERCRSRVKQYEDHGNWAQPEPLRCASASFVFRSTRKPCYAALARTCSRSCATWRRNRWAK